MASRVPAAISPVRVKMSPPRTLFTMTLLTLLALLVAPGSADARSCGRGQRPTVTATAASWRSKREPDYDYVVLFLSYWYGYNINISCSSNDASKLTIRGKDGQLQANGLNSTTIQVTLRIPDVGYFEYLCTDSNNNCTDTLFVDVKPAMSVTAQSLFPILDKYAIHSSYIVPRGQAYNVLCSAQQTSNLRIHRCREDTCAYVEELQTKPVNNTTVMVTVTNGTEGGGYTYTCESSRLTARLYVIIENYPEAQDFQCVLYQNPTTNEPKIDCSWKSLSENHIFYVSVLHDHKSTLICLDRPGSRTGGCGSRLHVHEFYDIYLKRGFSLVLQTCYTEYTSFCSNQTFKINLPSIIKPNPIYDFKLVNSSSQGATVAWSQSEYSEDWSYRIEYILLGTDWRPVNASTVRCVRYVAFRCELQLALPCPDAHYELRVYGRHKEAIGDLYWSNPSTLYFFTAPSTDGEEDPACGADFREPEPPLSVDAVLHEIRELISDKRKEGRALRKRISAHLTPTQSGDLSTAFDVGGITGAILAGLVADCTGCPAIVCAVFYILCAPTLLAYQAWGASSYMLNVGLLLAAGVLVNGPYALITTAVSAELGTHSSLAGNAQALATVTAIIDGTGSVGAALGPLLAGVVSSGGAAAWPRVFYMLIACDCLALFLLLRIVKTEVLRVRLERRLASPRVARIE